MQDDMIRQLQVLTERIAELESHVLSAPSSENPEKRGEGFDFFAVPSPCKNRAVRFANEQIDRLDRSATIVERFLDRRKQ